MPFTFAMRTLAVLGAGALTVVAGAPAAATGSHRPPPVRTIASGLDGPFGLDVHSGRALVAEGDSGEVTAVDLHTGAQRTLIANLPAPSAVAAYGGKIYVALGGPSGPGEGSPPPSAYPPASVLVADRDGSNVRVLADLLAYELKRNPDRQVQFNDAGEPYDALANPFSMTATRWGLLIADGGANDILRVDPRTGRVSTFFVPPNPRTPACLAPGAQANPGTVGCDSVPTGVAVRGNDVYVSTLGSDSPGAAVIYRLDGRTGRVLHKWTGFTALTGIAVAPHGTIFASEVLYNAPAGEGPPPPGFDPSTVGRITRIHHGKISYAPVTMPTGLDYVRGRLYASSWSIAGFLGIPHAGKIVEVRPGAFD